MSEQSTHLVSPANQSPTSEDQEVLLGEGAQYKVYDIGDGRVRKVPQTHERSVAMLNAWQYDGSDEEIAKEAENLGQLRDQSAKYISSLIESVPEAGPFFGNPTFQTDGSIVQDRLTTIGEALEGYSLEDAEEAINKYVKSIVKCWEYGCSDMVFNFVSNSAIRDGGTVAIDFGEMALDVETVHQIISNRRWEQSDDVINVLSPELRDFFIEFASAYLTHEKLDSNWGKIYSQGSNQDQ